MRSDPWRPAVDVASLVLEFVLDPRSAILRSFENDFRPGRRHDGKEAIRIHAAKRRNQVREGTGEGGPGQLDPEGARKCDGGDWNGDDGHGDEKRAPQSTHVGLYDIWSSVDAENTLCVPSALISRAVYSSRPILCTDGLPSISAAASRP